jgi:acetoin utilization deacetylase AcuC-like enzyme
MLNSLLVTRPPMTTALAYDERFCEHDTGPGHPERPQRVRAIEKHLRACGLWHRFDMVSFDAADDRSIEAIHDSAYMERLEASCRDGLGFIDTAESVVCPRSAEIARLAVGAALAAVDAVVEQRAANAFCALRPPGHHAERDRSMGFCLFNNVAVAANYAIERHGLERVAIVDFDVHHGNGTQHTFEQRADVLFVSLHEDPACLYPGTGFACETGHGEGAGFTINLPMAPHSADESYREAFEETVLPALELFGPKMLFVSAGFDASAADPLAHLMVTPDGFAWMTEQLAAVAARTCGGRIVSLLEGGYDLASLAECVQHHVAVLLEAGEK